MAVTFETKYKTLLAEIQNLQRSGKVTDPALKALLKTLENLLGQALQGKPADQLGAKLDQLVLKLQTLKNPTFNNLETAATDLQTALDGTTSPNQSYSATAAATILKNYHDWLVKHGYGRFGVADIDKMLAEPDIPEPLKNLLLYLKSNPSLYASLANRLSNPDGKIGLGEIEDYTSNSSMSDLDAMAALKQYFSQFAAVGGYTIAQLRDLADGIGKDGKPVPEQLRIAARLLLTNSRYFTDADQGSSGTADGKISLADLDAILDGNSNVEMTHQKAASELLKYLRLFNKDKLTRADLTALANSTDPKVTEEMKAAARWYLANTAKFDEASGAAETNMDGELNLTDLVAIEMGILEEDYVPAEDADVLDWFGNPKNFWDMAGEDGWLDKDDLRRILASNDPKWTTQHKKIALAMLRDQSLFDAMEMKDEWGLNTELDGKIGFYDVRMLYEQVNSDPQYDDLSQEQIIDRIIKYWSILAGDDGVIDKEDLKRVLKDPWTNRELRGLAGVLLFSDNVFTDASGKPMQSFEGNTGSVGDLFAALDRLGDLKNHSTDGKIDRATIDALKEDVEYAKTPMTVAEAVALFKQMIYQFGKDYATSLPFGVPNPFKDFQGMDKNMLRMIARGEMGDRASRDMVHAARLLLANPAILDAIDVANNSGSETWWSPKPTELDNLYSIKDIDKFLAEMSKLNPPATWRNPVSDWRGNSQW